MEVTGGDEVTCKVGLNAPPVNQGAIALISSDPATATVPAFVTVDADHYRSLPFSFKTQVTNVSTKLEISASEPSRMTMRRSFDADDCVASSTP